MNRMIWLSMPWSHRGLALVFVFAQGCSGRVDLGNASVASATSAPTPTTNDIELLARTESLARVTGGKLASVVADTSYLYFDAISRSADYSHSLHRCLKSDCSHTMTPLRELGWADNGIALYAGQLGWINDQGFQLCSAPNCADAKAEPGVIVEPGLSGIPILWTSDKVFWYLSIDSAIYACNRPACAGGPQQIASQADAQNLILIGDQLYWFDFLREEMQRTLADGSGPKERLTQEEHTEWTAVIPGPVSEPLLLVGSAQVDGPWIYAAFQFRSSPPARCIDCTPRGNLARWRYAEEGAPREWILVDDESLELAPSAFALASDGEVIWATADRALWSCVADNCAGTKRQLGIDAQVGFGRGIVADDQFIYWLSAPCDGEWQCEPDWNLKRTPRIAK